MISNLNITGMLICYPTWDDLDKYHESLKKLPIPELTILKAFNQIPGIPYPFTLALIVKDMSALNTLDNYLCDNHVDTGSDTDICVGELRIMEFMQMFPIGKYPPGFLKIRHERCELKAAHEGACMFCQFGHIMECHYKMRCDEAMCSHMERYE